MTGTRRPPRWLVIGTHVPPSGSGGGMVRYTVELVRAMAARNDVQVEVLCRSSATGFWAGVVGGPARVHPVPGLPVAAGAALERSGLALRAVPGRLDVVHGVKHIVPYRSSSLRVLTVHDMLPLDRPHDFPPVKRALLRRPYLASVRSSDVLLCVSEATRQRLTSYVPAADERATVVPLAVSPELLRATPDPVPALEGRRFVLVVGDPSPRKNLATVVSAWAAVRRHHGDAVLALVGPPGWGSSSGRADGAIDGVVPLGHVSDAELRWCYENATGVACPSILEGFGLPSIEAQSFGCPLLTSEDPALCEASAAGPVTARVYGRDRTAWASALTEVLSSRDSGRSAAKRGTGTAPARAAARSWADVADETVREVLRRLSGH